MAKKKSTPPKMSAPMMAVQGGNYGASIWFEMWVNWVDGKFPGAGEWIRFAADLIPWEKLLAAVMAAIADYQAGKDFLTILKEALAEWVEIEPGPEIRMSAKPLAETAA